MKFKVNSFLCCLPLALGALIIGYFSYFLFNFLGIVLIVSGVSNIQNNSIGFGVIIIAGAVVISLGYTAGSYLLIKGARERDFKKIQWFTIFIFIALIVTVFILIFAIVTGYNNKLVVVIITAVLSVVFAYAFIIVFSLQKKLQEEEEEEEAA